MTQAFSSSFSSDVFTVVVGSNGRRFQLHKDVLARESGYFRGLFNAATREVLSNSVIMDSEVDDETAFDKFVQYIYLHEYTVSDNYDADSFLLNAKVYVLAEKLDCSGLKDRAILRASRIAAALSAWRSGTKKIYGAVPTKLSVLILSLPEVIQLVYGYTYDENSGKLPSTGSFEKSDKGVFKGSEIAERDPFRLLLGRFSATCIGLIRQLDEFPDIISNSPEFLADVLLFSQESGPIPLDEKGYAKYA
ncbi:hypothetical protein ABW19_dt0206430 [Dactylella cylindrospora]|nr:hypothetical protein ABW19_dt0206430 [Dactylella cylindrospora]